MQATLEHGTLGKVAAGVRPAAEVLRCSAASLMLLQGPGSVTPLAGRAVAHRWADMAVMPQGLRAVIAFRPELGFLDLNRHLRA